MAKGTKLDAATAEIAKRLLSLPPKHHDEMKAPRKAKENHGAKGRASFAKQRSASQTDPD